ncbi:MAG TPA: hypothetical protein V6D15_02425 [Oculatellaceae cyanobacterium]|jgi:hypothetical protein
MKIKTVTLYFLSGIVFTLVLQTISSPIHTQAAVAEVNNIQLEQNKVSQADRIIDKIWKIPEVQQKAKEIKKRSHNTVHLGLMVAEEPTRNQPFYIVQVYESHPEQNVTIWYFRVNSKTGAISIQDSITGNYISLAQWRKKN